MGRAFVMGDRDLAVPVHKAGASVTMVAGRSSVSRFSWHADGWLDDTGLNEDHLIDSLLDAAGAHDSPATLFYQLDDHLLFASRHRDRLSRGLRFVVPAAQLVEQLVDKAAFSRLAVDLDLPVPPTWVVDVADPERHVANLPLPVVIKPLRREGSWGSSQSTKAVLAQRRNDVLDLLSRLSGHHDKVIAQILVPGPESRVESYHVHVEASGRIAAEFSGRKLRTYPATMGHSSALITTDAPDVMNLGRDLVERLGLHGVAKLDFKRDPEGRLWLLEVNPRFNLWHHLGAAAGVNIPASVLTELLDLPRSPAATAHPGVTWCRLERDVRAARAEGMTLGGWARWALRADSRSTLDPLDPGPLLGSAVMLARRRRAKAGKQ